ncbi:hypothetical protein NLX85_18180 [Micromonospora sp. A3M-1-15]|uniref:hypothetical protein n=1 Tax=Micromonospora sp. A3M-1-15 TaxID=2962035 RepID=UPI0020B6B9A4|nr:hypothetical protein [Micromonospora sp. A3M-1-15]MCP3785295.1 hypothetical protein [Micromonospora sp. A3M-1-15]
MEPAVECASHGWSIVTSASTNSQFAGALAGFVFTGIVVLFAMRGARYTHTLAVLAPTFIMLGFDSYIFSHVTGSAGDDLCARVWTDGMFASGMLGVGAAGVVTGACWLLAAHLDNPEQSLSGKASQASPAAGGGSIHLPWLAAIIMYGVTVAIVLLLAMTADHYLRIVTRDDESVWLLAIWSVPALVLLAMIVLGLIRRWRGQPAEWQEGRGKSFWQRSLRFAVYGMLLYAVVTPIVAGLLASASDDWWGRPGPWTVVPTIGIELVVASALLVALVLAAPPMPVSRPSLGHERPGVPVQQSGAQASGPPYPPGQPAPLAAIPLPEQGGADIATPEAEGSQR